MIAGAELKAKGASFSSLDFTMRSSRLNVPFETNDPEVTVILT